MLDVWLYGIFALDSAQVHRISHEPLLEIVRVPMVVNAGILGALLVPLAPQVRVREVLIGFSLLCFLVFTGVVFTGLLLGAAAVVFTTARLLHRWAQRRRNPERPLVVGWVVIHLMYLPVFFVILPPFDGHMTWGEVTQFWGAAFVTMKSVNYTRMACDRRVDPFAPGAVRRFLLYIIHFASFRFGPYQTFLQFDHEVSTCKERLSWRNRAIGAGRIGLGAIKFLIIFHWINKEFFYPSGYYGPLAEELFLNAANADPGHLWLMMYLYVLRMYLFISGLSDGVIGMNLMMGIRVPENSNWPFISRDVIEFWRRWHMQTGAFLRDEVFFPVGGLRNRNLGFFCVFAYCGFWHFPSASAILLFPILQVAVFEATHQLRAFWQRHRALDDWIYDWGGRLYLRESLLTHALGIVIVINVFALSCLFVFDHNYGGLTMLPRMFGF
ncbi:MAG: hypothetical protein KDA64_03595 [Rhodospirillaceae bacterium]|nr:hypothetical protein [Rhodospirillaceae bacterium]